MSITFHQNINNWNQNQHKHLSDKRKHKIEVYLNDTEFALITKMTNELKYRKGKLSGRAHRNNITNRAGICRDAILRNAELVLEGNDALKPKKYRSRTKPNEFQIRKLGDNKRLDEINSMFDKAIVSDMGSLFATLPPEYHLFNE